MSELKPCPFCGGHARPQREFMSDGYEYTAVVCLGCGATMPGNYSMHGDQAEWDWNRRAERTCRVVPDGCMGRCGACGADVFGDPDGNEGTYCPNCGAKVVERHAD